MAEPVGTDFASHVPDCLPTATFYPEPEAERYVSEALARGAQVFKVHLRVGTSTPRSIARPVWGLLADAAVPVLIHCGSAPLAGGSPVPDRSVRCWTGFRGCGSSSRIWGRRVRSVLDMVQARENTWLDTTMALTDFMQQLRPFPVGRLPNSGHFPGRAKSCSGQILNIPYPYAHQVEVLSDHGLDMPEVLWRAPVRLFGGQASGLL